MSAMGTAKAADVEREVQMLIAQRNAQVGALCGFADYELRAIRNEGGFSEHAVYALGFSDEHFGLQDTQAVSCDTCGGLFKDRLSVMRRHRLKCGWGADV